MVHPFSQEHLRGVPRFLRRTSCGKPAIRPRTCSPQYTNPEARMRQKESPLRHSWDFVTRVVGELFAGATLLGAHALLHWVAHRLGFAANVVVQGLLWLFLLTGAIAAGAAAVETAAIVLIRTGRNIKHEWRDEKAEE